MRGGKSFLILLVVALGARRRTSTSSSRSASRPAARRPRRTRCSPSRSTRSRKSQVKTASGETTTLKKTGENWQITAPEPLDADASEVGSLVSTLEIARDPAHDRRDAQVGDAVRPRAGALQRELPPGGRDGDAPPRHRQQDADRRRSLRARRRPAEGLPHQRVPGRLAQQADVRAARQERAEVRARRRRHRLDRSRGHAAARVREEGHRLAVHEAARRQGGLRRRRRPRRPAPPGAA